MMMIRLQIQRQYTVLGLLNARAIGLQRRCEPPWKLLGREQRGGFAGRRYESSFTQTAKEVKQVKDMKGLMPEAGESAGKIEAAIPAKPTQPEVVNGEGTIAETAKAELAKATPTPDPESISTPSSDPSLPTPSNTTTPSTSNTPEPPPTPIDVPHPIWYHRLGPFSTFFRWFHRTQTRRPLTVQLLTTLITYLCGDLLAQEIGGEKYSPTRTLRMLIIGGLASVPGFKWFIWLGNNFNYSSRWGSILVKVCVQQAVFTPVFNTYFFGMQAVLGGESVMGVLERVRGAVPTSMWNSLKLWPAVTAVSFAFVKAEYRFMFSGVFAVCWQAYLSFLNRREESRARAVLGGMVKSGS